MVKERIAENLHQTHHHQAQNTRADIFVNHVRRWLLLAHERCHKYVGWVKQQKHCLDLRERREDKWRENCSECG